MPIHSIKPIRTEEDHSAAIEEIAALWNAEPGSPEHDRLEVLGILVDAYESARWHPLNSVLGSQPSKYIRSVRAHLHGAVTPPPSSLFNTASMNA